MTPGSWDQLRRNLRNLRWGWLRSLQLFASHPCFVQQLPGLIINVMVFFYNSHILLINYDVLPKPASPPTQDIPESVNDGLWITGQTEEFNTGGTKGKQGLNRLYVVVMTADQGTLACCRIKSKSRWKQIKMFRKGFLRHPGSNKDLNEQISKDSWEFREVSMNTD